MKKTINLSYKRYLLFLFLCLLLVTTKAQVKFGIKAGYNISNIIYSGPNVISRVGPKSNFNAGILSRVPLFNTFMLQAEGVYSGQGADINDSSGHLNYNYINIPILFKYQNTSGIFAETGPQFGIKISAKYKSDQYTEDLNDQVKSTDFAWVFGLGYQISSINIGMDLRYNLGISNFSPYSIYTAKNSVFQFGAFFIF
ncbi:MAG: porin family protein [Bacteroidota bacterium]|nr:porin family protein [Bacteroidota bacterium]